MTDQTALPVDNPITSADQDVIGRAPVARDFARSVRELDPSLGVAVGVLGAWGHGKTSFVNLMRDEFAASPKLPIVEFNPWVFSGDQPLTDVFFREIAAELRLTDKSRFKKVAGALEKYGDALSPLAIIPGFGNWFDRALKSARTAAGWWGGRGKGSRSFRETVAAALKDLPHPLVVVIDDIDRLTTSEIRDIFKLVRLTASFPNVIYLLAFDRQRVEQALAQDGVPGRAYLEKILQLSFDLPMIPSGVLRSQAFGELNRILQDVDGLRFSQNLWADAYVELIEPMLQSLRDVTRFGLSARPTLRALGSEIEAVDLLVLEAIRVFRPERFEAVRKARIALTETQGGFGRGENPQRKAEIEALINAAGETDAPIAQALIRRLFPAGRTYIENTTYGREWITTWKREHRVAYIGYLELYLGRCTSSELASFQHAETAFSLAADPARLSDYLDAVPPDQLEETISALGVFDGDFPEASVVPTCVLLLNRIPDLPERPSRGMYDILRSDSSVTRVAARLLATLEEDDRDRAATEIVAGVDTLSSQDAFIQRVGRAKDPNNALISRACTAELDEQLARRIRASPPPTPEREWNLLGLSWWLAEREGDGYTPPVLTDASVIRALLQSARSTTRAQAGDSRHIDQEERLAWDGLVRVAGSEIALATAIATLREHDGEVPLVILAERYASGWRPTEH